MQLTEEEFVDIFATGSIGHNGDGYPLIELPETIYKKGNGELNAEKVMILVLKARSKRREKNVTREVTQNEPCPK